jgi:hypothetical protein
MYIQDMRNAHKTLRDEATWKVSEHRTLEMQTKPCEKIHLEDLGNGGRITATGS